MRKRPCLILLAALNLLCAGVLAEDSLTQKTSELKQLRAKIHSLQRDLAQRTTRHDNVQQSLRQAELAISNLKRDSSRLTQDITAAKAKLGALEKAKQRQQRALADHRVMLTQQMRMSYASGQQEYVKMLLNQQDPATMNRVMTYYNYINMARLKHIQAAREAFLQYEKTSAAISQEAAKIEDQRSQIQRQQDTLAEKQAERKAILAQLEKQSISDTQRLKQFQQNERSLIKLMEKLQNLIDDVPKEIGGSFSANRGQMRWPANGKVIVPRGKPERFGVVIKGTEGGSVTSVFSGRVAYADWFRGFGLLIIVDHGDGYMSLYGHNQTLLKEIGDWVRTGEQIATVGNSGGEQTAQLYFEIRRDGTPQNPKKWCQS